MMTELIIIRGGSGTGKTTLAAALRPHFPAGVTIESDHVRQMFNEFDWMCKQKYMCCLSALARLVRFYAAAQLRPIIVVDTFERRYMRLFRSRLPSGFEPVIISLYADEKSVRARMSARDGATLIEQALVNSINQGKERRLEGSRALALDTSDLTPAMVCSAALDFIGRSPKRRTVKD